MRKRIGKAAPPLESAPPSLEVEVASHKKAGAIESGRCGRRLHELLPQITRENSHEETDFGPAVGKETF